MSEGLNAIRPQLEWVCEALIPADPAGELPSALQAGVIDRLLPRALKVRPDFEAPLLEALGCLPAEPPADPLGVLQALSDGRFDLISHLIAGAYFIDEEVNRRLKYPGQEALLANTDYDEVMEVAERIMNRGVIYIATPERA
jgi:hypothetical protein